MSNRFKLFLGGTAALLGALTLSEAQISSPMPSQKSPATDSLQAAPAADSQANPATAPTLPTAPIAKTNENSPLTLVQASTVTAASSPSTTTTTTTKSTLPATTTDPAEADTATDSGGVGVREFQGDDVGQVLRLLARQAKINMVVSEAVVGTVTMRLEDVTALQAIAIIVKAKGLFMTGIDNVYYIKTPAEQTAEPTESDKYQFSYARAEATKALLGAQLQSKDPPMIDERTNTIFYRETRSNIDNIRKLLVEIDKPTKQVMIEARLVEVTANPKQAYGINWAGVVGSASNPQTLSYAGGNPQGVGTTVVNDDGTITPVPGTPPTFTTAGGKLQGNDFFFDNTLTRLGGQFAILTAPQMSVTIAALNEDSDAEFLANPRVVTADNMQAKIEIIRNQPVPQLTFNEQTASSVFGGFQDKKFGNTLIVKPSINKDHFITLAVKPEISNKVGDQAFFPPGATQPVLSPIIDTRSLDSNVLIKSGDTLAIGGLLQDEVTKSRTKVPLVGDIPIIGYLFQSRTNIRTKRNLLVFVTPTIIDQRYGTGLEDQISGVHNTGEEYADPNGWRNNAKGAVRLVPTANRQVVADYPKPGTPPAPARGRTTTTTTTEKVQFMSTAKDRDF